MASTQAVRPDAAIDAVIDAEKDPNVVAVLQLWRTQGKLTAPTTHEQLKDRGELVSLPLSCVQRACSKATKAVSGSPGLLEHLQQLRQRLLERQRERGHRARPDREVASSRRAVLRSLHAQAAAVSAAEQLRDQSPVSIDTWNTVFSAVDRAVEHMAKLESSDADELVKRVARAQLCHAKTLSSWKLYCEAGVITEHEVFSPPPGMDEAWTKGCTKELLAKRLHLAEAVFESWEQLEVANWYDLVTQNPEPAQAKILSYLARIRGTDDVEICEAACLEKCSEGSNEIATGGATNVDWDTQFVFN